MRRIDRVKQLERALRPFALATHSAEDDEPKETKLANSSARYCITIGDLLRAKKVLAVVRAR